MTTQPTRGDERAWDSGPGSRAHSRAGCSAHEGQSRPRKCSPGRTASAARRSCRLWGRGGAGVGAGPGLSAQTAVMCSEPVWGRCCVGADALSVLSRGLEAPRLLGPPLLVAGWLVGIPGRRAPSPQWAQLAPAPTGPPRPVVLQSGFLFECGQLLEKRIGKGGHGSALQLRHCVGGR